MQPQFEENETTQKNIDNAIAKAKSDFPENRDALDNEYKKIDEMGLGKYSSKIKDGTLQSVFGNVDMDNLQVIDWNIENIEKWKDALSDIKYYDEDGNFIDSYYDQLKESAENGKSAIDTVFGDILKDIEGFDGISDIAFSHIVNDENGEFKFLGQKTAEEYLYGILEIAKQDGDMSIDHILELDKKGIGNAEVYNAQGKLTGRAHIHGIISGFNENAGDISKLTHFAGDFGAIKINTKGIEATTNAIKATADVGDEATPSLSELEKVSDNIGKLSTAYKELSDNGYITIKTINELQTATGLSGDEWAEYETKLLNAKKGSAEFNQVMSDLTYKMIESQVKTEDLANATDEEIKAIENKIAATLRENGVTNASAVAHSAVVRASEQAAAAKATEATAAYANVIANGEDAKSAYEDTFVDMKEQIVGYLEDDLS